VAGSNAHQYVTSNYNKQTISDQACTQANYAGSIFSGHSQGQALVETLAFTGVTRHINKFLRDGVSKKCMVDLPYTLVVSTATG